MKHIAFKPKRLSRQTGVTLVELMIALVIGLILAIAGSTVYLYSKQSFNTSTETSQLEENGRFAINLLSKYIQTAGFVMIDPTIPSPQGPIDNKIFGCRFGMTNPTSGTTSADLACQAATPAGEMPSESIELFSETDVWDSTGVKFQGFDCIGESSINMGPTINETRSYFYISQTDVTTPTGTVRMGQLSCLADRSITSTAPDFQRQPLIPGIEQIAFNYILPSAADPNVGQSALPASSLTATQWPSVLAVDVCVLGKSIQPASNDSGTSYTDCYGTAIAAIPGEIYRTFRATVRLRNKSAI